MKARRKFVVPIVSAIVGVMVMTGVAIIGTGEARAADTQIDASGNNVSAPARFSPNIASGVVGDTFTFMWVNGTHTADVLSPDRSSEVFDTDLNSSHMSGTFTPGAPGTYYFYCDIHASEELATEAHVQADDAMVGKIVVAAATASPTATATTGTSPTATATTATATSTPTRTATTVPPTPTRTNTPTATTAPPTATPTHAASAVASAVPGPPNTGSGTSGGTGFGIALLAGLGAALMTAATGFALTRISLGRRSR